MEFFPTLQTPPEPTPDPVAIVRQETCMNQFVNAVNNGQYDKVSGALFYLSDQIPASFEQITPEYIRDVVFPGSPAKKITSLEVYELYAVAYFEGLKIRFDFELFPDTCKIAAIQKDTNVPYYPEIYVEPEELPPDENLIPLQTSCVNGFVSAVNSGNHGKLNGGALSYLDPLVPALADIDEYYVSGFMFPLSPFQKITFVKVYDTYAVAQFNNMLVRLTLRVGSNFCYIATVHVGVPNEYFPEKFTGTIEATPPPVDTIPLQNACANGFVNAINAGNYVTAGGARSYMNPASPNYYSVTKQYLQGMLFPGSPITRLTDLKVYETHATVKFGMNSVVLNFLVGANSCYISDIYAGALQEYFPEIFTGVIEPVPPPIDTVALQRTCAEGFFGSVNAGQFTQARNYVDPTLNSYRNFYGDYVRYRIFPGSPTKKCLNIKIYDDMASCDFGSDKIYVYYRLYQGRYVINEIYRAIMTEFYPTINWSS